MENKSHALAAGTFVLLVLALLVALAVWLTRDSRALRLYELSSPGAVTGLQPQASVRFKGVNVGKVTSIGFDPLQPSQVLIRIAVDEQAPITSATFAMLGFQGVTGLAFVQLDDSGEPGRSLLTTREQPARIPMRPSLLSNLSDQGQRILSQFEVTSRHLNELLPQLGQNASATLKTLKDTSVRVGDSADEARKSARAFRVVTERMNGPGGTLDKLAEGANTLATLGEVINSATLPRLNRAADDAARSARELGRAANTVSDNPQSLIFGNGPPVPGPGEPGFIVSPGKP
jgi:phospholipid/cholesterol/gamma-HCH transport system substrate-binding protein